MDFPSSSGTCSGALVTGCTAFGFACAAPWSPSKLNLGVMCTGPSTDPANASLGDYCCYPPMLNGGGPGTVTLPPECLYDPAVSCPGALGYTCTNGAPKDLGSTLACELVAQDGGVAQYCCASGD
jgi:hypothetical protein